MSEYDDLKQELKPKKCEICNGPLSPKNRPHNCPGGVM